MTDGRTIDVMLTASYRVYKRLQCCLTLPQLQEVDRTIIVSI